MYYEFEISIEPQYLTKRTLAERDGLKELDVDIAFNDFRNTINCLLQIILAEGQCGKHVHEA